MPKALVSTQTECMFHLSAQDFKSFSSIQIAYFFPFYFSDVIKSHLPFEDSKAFPSECVQIWACDIPQEAPNP